MFDEEVVLCASSAYEKKYYFNDMFDSIPQQVKDELKIMCVLFTEDVGGVFMLKYNENGDMLIETDSDEGDLLYDEIGAGLKIKKIQNEKEDLFRSLEMFYKVFVLGEDEMDD